MTGLWRRVSGIVLLFVTLAALCIWYGSLSPAPALGAYPGENDIAMSGDQYVGDRVGVSGTVQSTDPVRITVDTDAGPLSLTIRDVPVDVAVGYKLRVFGELQPGNTVQAERTIRIPPSRLWYTYAVSLVGGLWVLGRLVRHWTIDTESWTVRPRVESRTFVESVRRWGRTNG